MMMADPSKMLRVLFVEDSEDDALLMTRTLSRGGYKVVSERVQTADTLRKQLADGNWDLVISDFHMPEFSGPRALAMVRELAPELPFIAVSGHLAEENIVEAMREGVHDYLLKSNLTRLVPAVERAIVEHENIHARKTLEESLLLLRAAAESVGDGMVIANIESDPSVPQIAYVNQSIEAITGYDRNELLSKPVWTLLGPEPDQAALDMLKGKLGAGKPFSGEGKLQRRNGVSYFAEWQAYPVRDRHGNANHVVAVIRDITERRRQEQIETELRRQLAVSQKMEAIGRLAAGVAHDFNNLLVVINGHAQLVNADLRHREPEVAQDVLNILRAGERAADLTRRLLSFSRNQGCSPRNLNLNDNITEMEKLLRRLLREDVIIQKTLEAKIWPIHADSGQIDQIILNLAVNASDAMDRGGKLTFETRNETRDGVRFTILKVSDCGHGMSPETQKRLFEPFFTTKDPGKGTGLGLATVYSVVKSLGGEIEVESKEDCGTCFSVWLPASVSEESKAETVPETVRGGRETVLVVEDQTEVRNVAVRILGGLGYRVLEARNGREALQIVEQSRASGIDLLLSDVVLPEMSGLEVANRLKLLMRNLKVIFVSGHVAEVTDSLGVDVSKMELLRKPYDVNELARRVRTILDQPGQLN